MLINQKQEGESGRMPKGGSSCGDGDSHEYQTANELYEMIAKKHPFDPHGKIAYIQYTLLQDLRFISFLDKKSLTTQDLVILYKNIEIGTKLLTNNSYDFKSKTPNQHVESVVYNDEVDSDGSDVSEIYSNEDLNNVFMINSERIDFFNNIPSHDNTLCQKFGNIDMKSSKLSAEYDKYFLFNDPFIKEQFNSLNNISKSKNSDSSVLPTSLLDYICCKRLEDNYNFYMDNIIQYVKHTIDQLKRISNGDYLTERVKEKWREVGNDGVNTDDYKSTVLANSNSIQLHVEDKLNGNKSTWDDIVHSEMDIRSLSKILEKKIVVEVPKLLCGSFKLFSKRYKNSLIIRYKKDKEHRNKDKREESRVDVVLKLKRSGSGHVISNIDSVMILKTAPNPVVQTEAPTKFLALQFNEVNNADKENENRLKIVELGDDNEMLVTGIVSENVDTKTGLTNQDIKEVDYGPQEYYVDRGDSDIASDAHTSERRKENFNIITPDELRCTMRRLNMQLPVLEEIEDACTKRKKSPTKVRIKSPYENKSFIMEEKKRKKLLEIREKREKKKNTVNESCKITKHKYGKGVIMPQPSSSVTKLSITNKSFYNSIYGHSLNSDSKTIKKIKGPKGDSVSTIDLHNGEEDVRKDSSVPTPERNSQKYINRSYYLDDAETEVMHMQMKKDCINEEVKNSSTSSTSPLSNETSHNIALFKQFIDQSVTDLSITDTTSSLQPNAIIDDSVMDTKNDNQGDISTNSNRFMVPTNTPKVEVDNLKCLSDIPPTVKCRKSIEKVYDLIKAISKTDACDNKIERSQSKTIFGKVNMRDMRGESSTIQASDSGTSIKHQLTSSSPSCYSFDKTTAEVTTKNLIKQNEQPISVVPKVIISSKTKTGKDRDKNDKKNKKCQPDVPKNPLKAISQLLHEFDHVQKTRYKNGHELKSNKKSESTSEGRAGSRQFSRKTLHQEQHLRNNDSVMPKGLLSNERRTRHSPGKESLKITQPHHAIEEKGVDKGNKKKLADFIDEVKELNGEAVRGPPKRSSRLNSLAQPKKSYVQAHHEEYQSRYGRNIVSDRLHKLATAPNPVQERNLGAINYRSRQRRGTEVLTGATKQLHSSGPCLGAKARRSASSSPDGNGRRSPVLINGPSYNYSNVPETSEPLKKKMVAVETYVKSHFGHVSPSLDQGDCQVRKSRVPLIPTDFDVASLTSSPTADESTTLGNKLHYIIDSMVSNLPTLTALAECNESSTKLEKDEISIEDSSKCDEIVSCSDYPVDVFEDKNIVTAVGSILNNKDDEIVEDEVDTKDQNYDKEKFCSTDELQMLENALYNQISNGNFQKRLRIKNLTLTPKQSLQQVFVLQSGDSRSMFLKSSMSQNIDNSKTDTIKELAMLPVLSKSHMGWEFSKFPLQIATVGYAFSEMKPVVCSSTSRIKSVDDDHDDCNVIKTSSKIDQCFTKSTIQLQCSSENQSNERNILSSVENAVILKNDIKTDELCKVLDIKKSLSGKEKPRDHLEEGRDHLTKVATVDNAENVSYTTSLDILVGLLNEIKKITSCQANIVSLDNGLEVDLEKKELEIILNKAADQESSVDHSLKNIVSQATLESLQHLGLNSSNYSLVSSHKRNILMIDKQMFTSEMNLPYFNDTLTVDKEINVNIYEKRWIHQCTEMSEHFPIRVNQSTKITDSLMTITTKPSSQSVYYFDDCQTLQTSSVKPFNLQMRLVDSSKSNYLMACPNKGVDDSKRKNQVRPYKTAELVMKKEQSKNKRRVSSQENNMISEFDPIIKMKRDILVTVYSILVFTVFAALSFPQFVY